jgi:hypothetical protein
MFTTVRPDVVLTRKAINLFRQRKTLLPVAAEIRQRPHGPEIYQ